MNIEEYAPDVNLNLYNHVKAAHEALKTKEKTSTEAFHYRPQLGTG